MSVDLTAIAADLTYDGATVETDNGRTYRVTTEPWEARELGKLMSYWEVTA